MYNGYISYKRWCFRVSSFDVLNNNIKGKGLWCLVEELNEDDLWDFVYELVDGIIIEVDNKFYEYRNNRLEYEYMYKVRLFKDCYMFIDRNDKHTIVYNGRVVVREE